MNLNQYNIPCQNYLDSVFNPMLGDGARSLEQKSQISATYGEILYPAIEKLISLTPLTQNDVFVDLGSGIGKIVLQVFMNTQVREARGIELSPELHAQAIQANQRIYSEFPHFYTHNRKIEFLSGSFLDISLTDVTIALVNSLCYSQAFLHQLGQVIDAAPSIHTFMSLRPILTMRRLKFKKAIPVECSWDTSLCYLYTR